jgi:hypothetical protein
LVGLIDRVAWAIDTIKWDDALDRGIQDVELAKILKTNKDTLAAYRKRKGLTKGAVLEQLVVHYNFSPEWLFKGTGEPFPGARSKYPDLCGPEPIQTSKPAAKHSVNEEPAKFDISSTSGAIGEDVALAIQVLQSRTPYATALHLNIRSFADAVIDKARIVNIEESYARLEAENAQMQIQLANLQEAVTKLMEKNVQSIDKTDEIDGAVVKEKAG